MTMNKRAMGARTTKAVPKRTETDQNAGMPRKPEPYGLTEPVDDVDEKTRHSDGVDPPETRPLPPTAPGKR